MAESAALLVDDVLPYQPIRQWVTSFLSPDDDRVGAGNGGLGGVLDALQRSGAGTAADSWVVPGQNPAISPAQLESAIGSDTLRQFAHRAGVSERDSAGVLADLLPELVNQMTPRGQVPAGGELGGLLRQLLR